MSALYVLPLSICRQCVIIDQTILPALTASSGLCSWPLYLDCVSCVLGMGHWYVETLVPVLSTWADDCHWHSHLSQHALLLLVSGRISPKLTSMSLTSNKVFLAKYLLITQLGKSCHNMPILKSIFQQAF